MSARKGRRKPAREGIDRLIEPDHPASSNRAGEAPAPLRAPRPAVGLDDVRTPLTTATRADLPPPRPGIRRRDILAWGGAAALLPMFPGIARAQQPTPDAAIVTDMSVGFVEGSESWPTFEKLSLTALSRGYRAEAGAQATAHSVVPAVEMIAGDQQLASELVQVGVRGLYPVLTHPSIEEIRLTVLFPSPNPARRQPLPFYAWSYKARPAPNPSPPLRFVAPLDIDGGFRLQLDVVPAGPGRALTRRSVADLTVQPPGGSFVTNFTVDWYEGRPKLQRGVYLLGLSPGTWGTQRTLPLHRTGSQRPIELLSLILTVEAAPALED